MQSTLFLVPCAFTTAETFNHFFPIDPATPSSYPRLPLPGWIARVRDCNTRIRLSARRKHIEAPYKTVAPASADDPFQLSRLLR